MILVDANLLLYAVNRSAPEHEIAVNWLDEQLYPFESHHVELSGNQVHYVDEGTGPALLFLHAGPAWSFI